MILGERFEEKRSLVDDLGPREALHYVMDEEW